MLAWITATPDECGVQTVRLVVGAHVREFDAALSELSTMIDIRPAPRPDWHPGNGLSAAVAETLVPDSRFFLLMGDHLVTANHLRRVATGPPAACALATSAPMPWIDSRRCHEGRRRR